MPPREDLQTLLEVILGSDAVYFQPPSTVKIKYPCIVYERVSMNTKFADNKPYSIEKQYSLTIIDSNPDSDIPGRIAALDKCVFNRHFTTNNLNHDVFTLYF